MDLSKVPFTLDYELKKLKDKLEEIEKNLKKEKSDNNRVLNFSWFQYKKEKDNILKEIITIEELLENDHPDPDFIA